MRVLRTVVQYELKNGERSEIFTQLQKDGFLLPEIKLLEEIAKGYGTRRAYICYTKNGKNTESSIILGEVRLENGPDNDEGIMVIGAYQGTHLDGRLSCIMSFRENRGDSSQETSFQ